MPKPSIPRSRTLVLRPWRAYEIDQRVGEQPCRRGAVALSEVGRQTQRPPRSSPAAQRSARAQLRRRPSSRLSGDVGTEQPASPVLGEAMGLEHPGRERRVGADHRRTRQQVGVPVQREPHQHAQHQRAREVDEQRAQREARADGWPTRARRSRSARALPAPPSTPTDSHSTRKLTRQPRSPNELGRQEHRAEPAGHARACVRCGERQVSAFEHPHQLDHHRRERRQRAAHAGAEERTAVQRWRQALLQAGDEEPEQRRADAGSPRTSPRAIHTPRDQALRQRRARERADEPAGEDRRQLLTVEPRQRRPACGPRTTGAAVFASRSTARPHWRSSDGDVEAISGPKPRLWSGPHRCVGEHSGRT